MIRTQDLIKLMFIGAFFIAGVLMTAPMFAAVDPVNFEDNPQLEERYKDLTQTLRCPKCQNQSIAGSDAPIANDMRKKVESLLREGQSNDQIEQYMIDRYGDFVTYNPPLNSRTYALWFAPPLFLILIAIGFWFALGRRKGSNLVENENTKEEKELE